MSVGRLSIGVVASTLSVRVCRSLPARLRGYGFGRGPHAAVWLEPCAAVHTLWPWRPIDVVFVARDGRVLRVCSALRPGRFRWCAGAHAVLELHAGSAPKLGIGPGSRVSVRHGD